MLKKVSLLISLMFMFFSFANAQTAKSTLDGMMQSYNGEMNASAMYAEFAKKSQNKSVSTMFKAASAAEAIHAKLLNDMAISNKLTTKPLTAKIDPVKTSTDNAHLQAGIKGETYEYTKMYPAFSKVAAAEGNKDVANLMNMIASVEKTHAQLYDKTMKDLAAGQGLPEGYYVCPVCGYIEKGSSPDSCPICNAAGSTFQAFLS